jgi:hypothetical protein
MNRIVRSALVVLLGSLLASCGAVEAVFGHKTPESQNKAVCQAVPAQGSPARCVITKADATVLPEQKYGKWIVVMATMSSPPGTKVTKAVFRRDLCTPQGCNRTVSCMYGCGTHHFPNDGIDYSKAGEGVVQWWGRVDNEDPEGWLFDLHYQ